MPTRLPLDDGTRRTSANRKPFRPGDTFLLAVPGAERLHPHMHARSPRDLTLPFGSGQASSSTACWWPGSMSPARPRPRAPGGRNPWGRPSAPPPWPQPQAKPPKPPSPQRSLDTSSYLSPLAVRILPRLLSRGNEMGAPADHPRPASQGPHAGQQLREGPQCMGGRMPERSRPECSKTQGIQNSKARSPRGLMRRGKRRSELRLLPAIPLAYRRDERGHQFLVKREEELNALAFRGEGLRAIAKIDRAIKSPMGSH